MRLSLLEEREAVMEIIVETLNDNYAGQFQFSIERPTNSKDYLTFYGNKYLNFFATTLCPSSNFEVIKKEYANSQQFWKKAIQKIYVGLSTIPFFFSKLHHYKFYVVGKQKDNFGKLLIMGGNSRLRIIEAEKKQTHVILKNSYPDFFIKNEIQVRSNQKESNYFPKLISHQKNSFTESLHPGIPINRLTPEQLKDGRDRALKILKEELQKDAVQISETYFPKLIKSISSQLKKVDLEKEIGKLDFFKNQSFYQTIPVSTSHGDYQDANILSTEDGLKIIDWESVSQRSVFYDQITLLAAARSGWQRDKIKKAIEKIENKYEFSNEQIFNIYLLEELEYRLSYLPLYQKDKTSKLNEITYLIQLLEEETLSEA